MGSVPSTGQTLQISNSMPHTLHPKPPNPEKTDSEESKGLPIGDPKKLEIGEYFLDKYLFYNKKKLQKNVRLWDGFLKKIQKSKGLFNSSELPLPSNPINNQGSFSPSNSCHSSLTFDTTLIQLFFKSNKGKFMYKINHSPGPPMKYRFATWKTILNITNSYVDYGYEKHKKDKTFHDVERDIKKDLHRTYPTQPLFLYKDRNELTLGEKQLYNVLKAIANNFPRIGYCQGMNFVVGFLLLISGGNENDAFCLFQRMGLDTRFHILGLFENNFPLVNLYCFIFWKLMKENHEDLKNHLEKLGVPDHAWISKWFMMLFLYSLPLDVICRVWDFILSEESLLASIKISLALMKILKPDLLKFEEIFEVMEYFKILKGGLYEPYQSVFIVDQAAKSQRISLKGDILVRKARKIKLNRKIIGEAASEFLKANPQFENHVLMQYYVKFDVIEYKELKIFEENIRKYYTSYDEEERPKMKERTFSFENLPILTENDEFLGVNKMKKIPVFNINNLVIFSKMTKNSKAKNQNNKKNEKNEKNEGSDEDEDDGSSSDEDFPTTKDDKLSEKKLFD